MNYPDSPEAVALELLREILERDNQDKQNEPLAARMIELYAQCLAAVTQKSRETPALFH
jgi:hypothetical protein